MSHLNILGAAITRVAITKTRVLGIYLPQRALWVNYFLVDRFLR
jgi:hypothetical protein